MTIADIRPALRAHLLADASISSAVGGSRIYPIVLPQGITATSIVISTITDGSDYHMQGPSGLGTARVQINCWAQTPDAAEALSDLVLERLSGHSGEVLYGSNSPQSSVLFRGVFHDIGGDDYDDSAKLYARRRDFIVRFAQF